LLFAEGVSARQSNGFVDITVSPKSIEHGRYPLSLIDCCWQLPANSEEAPFFSLAAAFADFPLSLERGRLRRYPPTGKVRRWARFRNKNLTLGFCVARPAAEIRLPKPVVDDLALVCQ